MRFKGHHDRRTLQLSGLVDHAPENFTMTEMDPVEIAEGQDCPAGWPGQTVKISYNLHYQAL
jgi:hypothetical protein